MSFIRAVVMSQALIVVVAAIGLSAHAGDDGNGEPLVLSFPLDRSVGRLHLRDADFEIDDWVSVYEGWTEWTAARRTLRVPAGKVVRLDLSRSAAEDPEFLRELPANALVMLDAERHDVNDRLLRAIAHMTDLRILDIDYNPLTDKGLSQLACLPNVEVLDIDDTRIGHDDAPWLEQTTRLKLVGFRRTDISPKALSRLGRLDSLTSVDLSNTAITDDDLSHIAGLVSLRRLNLQETKITDDGLRHLANLKQLETIQLAQTLVTDDGLAALANLTRLREIDFRDVRVRGPGLSHLTELPQLRRLRFQRHIDDSGMQYLGRLSQLEELVLDDCRATDAGMPHLAGLKQLRSLVLDTYQVTDDGLAVLDELPLLESLSLDDCRLTAAGLKRLAANQNLKSLELSTCPIGDDGLKVIGSMEQLEELDLGDQLETSWEGLQHIAQCRRLKRLELNCHDLSGSSSLVPMGQLANLEHLRMFYPAIPPAGLQHFSRLSTLKVLQLYGPFTDTHAKYVAQLLSLEKLYLGLGDVELTDMGIRHIATLKHLQELHIQDEITVTDEGLMSLANLESLRWLNLRSERVTREGAERLAREAPSLEHFYTQYGNLFLASGIDLERQRLVGQPAPQLRVRTLDGKTIDLADLRGKVVVLYFWGTWCGPCVAGTPEREALFGELLQDHDDLVALSLSSDNGESRTRDLLSEHEVHSLHAVIPFTGPITDNYFVSGAGWWFVIDRTGRVTAMPTNLDEVRTAVDKLQ